MKKINVTKLTIIYLSIDDIKTYALNPRDHPPEQVSATAASIRKYGFNSPVLVNPDYVLIAGHNRLAAARAVGMIEMPAIVLPHLSESEQRAYRIADNAISLKGSWSLGNLAVEVDALSLDTEFDLSACDLGFETGELDYLMSEASKTKPAELESGVSLGTVAVSMLGDIWSVGPHRIICGDSTMRQTFVALLGTELADLVLTDIPYNQPINGHVGGRGKTQHREFAQGSGELSAAQFLDFNRTTMMLQAAFSRPGALNLQFNDWRMLADTLYLGKEIFEQLLNICVWAKSQPGQGALWRSQHEMIVVHRVAGGKHLNNVQLGRMGRNRSNLWQYPGTVGFGPERKNLSLHPTCKNVDMLADAIMDVTNRKALVLDPFLGSGSCALACHKTGRRCRGIEIDPLYVDLAVQRLAEAVGEAPINQDGHSFEEARSLRADGAKLGAVE